MYQTRPAGMRRRVAAPVREGLVNGDDAGDSARREAVEPGGAIAEIGAAVMVVPDQRALAREGGGETREEERGGVSVDDADAALVDEADELSQRGGIELAAAFEADARYVRRDELAERTFGARGAQIWDIAIAREQVDQIHGDTLRAADVQWHRRHEPHRPRSAPTGCELCGWRRLVGIIGGRGLHARRQAGWDDRPTTRT